jgi:hypothetical protein
VSAFAGLLIAVMGVVAGFGSFAARVAELPRVPAGESRDVPLTAGTHGLYQTGPASGLRTSPAAEVLGPDGAVVVLTARPGDSFGGGNDQLRQLAELTAPTTGTYRVSAVAVEGATSDGLAVGPPYAELATASTGLLYWAVIVGGALFVIGIVAVVVGLTRRERVTEQA